MTTQQAIAKFKEAEHDYYIKIEYLGAIKAGIHALELLNVITDRPCTVCKYHKENGCCKWDCVFDKHISGKEQA